MNRLLFILIACLLVLPTLSASSEEPVPITAQDYCRFLKCVAVSDPHCFYNEKLALDPTCIVREGIPGNYSYSVLPGKEKQLVSYLSWHDVACYAYWKKQEEDHLNNDLILCLGGFQVDDAAQNSDQELKSNIVHFSFMNDKALDNGSLPPQEPPSWISYMMIPFFILGESGQAVSKASPDHISVPSEEGLHLKEEPLNRMGMSNMNLAAAGSIANHTISSALSEQAEATSTSPTGKLGATSLVQVTSNPGLGKRTSENANKSPGLPDVLMPFIQHYNRASNISTKKEQYQKELKILSPNSDRALMLNHLVSILENAISYQDALIKPLIESVGTFDDPKKVASKTFLNFIDATIINDRPNKIERVAKQIEEDYEHLAVYQNKLSEVQTLSGPNPTDHQHILLSHLNKAIELQRTLIEQRASYAPLLHPPFEQLNTTTQANVDQHQWKLVETEALASSEYLFFRANTAQGLGQHHKAFTLNNAGGTLFDAAQEAQKPAELRNLDVISCFQHAVDLYQEAANAWDQDQALKARFLHSAGSSLFNAAHEAQKTLELRNLDVIDLYHCTANLYQEAANAWKPDQSAKVTYLGNAGNAFFKAAEEAQKPPELRKQEVINFFKDAVDLYQNAVHAWNQNQPDKARYLNKAGKALFRAAQEAQKPPELRNPAVIYRLQRAANLYQEATSIWNPSKPNKAIHLNNAGSTLFQAAEEAQKPPELRKQEVIDLFQRATNLHQKASNAWDPSQPLKANCLNKAGIALSQAAQEMKKPEPNLEVIARLVKEAEEFEEKANSLPSCIIS